MFHRLPFLLSRLQYYPTKGPASRVGQITIASFFLTRINTITQQPTRFTLIQRQFRRRSFNPLFHFLDVFGRWNILWQGAANALDGISNFLANIFVGLDGMGLVAHAILRQLVASLRQTKLVGRELGRVHPVEQVILFGNDLRCLIDSRPEPP